MSHLVAPLSFRLGKTFPWDSNVSYPKITAESIPGRFTTLNLGLDQVSVFIIRRLQFVAIKGALSINLRKFQWKYKLLYFPEMKLPLKRSKFRSLAAWKVLFNPTLYHGISFKKKLVRYFIGRHYKNFRFRRIRRKGRFKLNPWITKRMLRGVNKLFLKRYRYLSKKKGF